KTVTCCSGAVGVGLYGNDDVHNGMLELLTAARSIDDIIGNIKNQTVYCSLVMRRPLVSAYRQIQGANHLSGDSN
ncbi:chloride channel activity protein, partial [Homalodisca vitripennis]